MAVSTSVRLQYLVVQALLKSKEIFCCSNKYMIGHSFVGYDSYKIYVIPTY
jgi:hypothetical protein